MLVGLVGAFDFTASLMSIQPYYIFLEGPERLYGLTFGCYDIAQMVAVPIFARFVDRTQRFQDCFVIGIGLTVIGNLLYALLFVIQNATGLDNSGWVLMIIARFVMGFGSATLITGLTYITKYTTMKQRFGAVGSYRVAQTIARMFGPMVGFLFVALPDPAPTASIWLNMFNFFTMPGWFSAILGVVCIICVRRWFRDSSVPVPKSQTCSNKLFVWNFQEGGILRSTSYAFCITFVFSMIQWTITSNMFAFATGLFHVVEKQVDLWKPWTGYGIGALSASRGWKYIGNHYGEKIKYLEKKFAMLGAVLIVGGGLFFIRYSTYAVGSNSHPSIMWFGTCILGLGVIFFQTNMEVVYSKVITDKFLEVGNCHGLLLGAYQISGSLARFMGPFIGGSLLFVELRGYDNEYKVDNVLENCPADLDWPCYQDSTQSEMCNDPTTDPPKSEVCCFETSYYYIENCEVAHINAVIITLIIVGCACLFVTRWYLKRVAIYAHNTSMDVGEARGHDGIILGEIVDDVCDMVEVGWVPENERNPDEPPLEVHRARLESGDFS